MQQFSIPKSLVKDIQNEDCVTFLGAGASTESIKYFGRNLVETVAETCDFPHKSHLSFPKLAQYYCDTMDGGFKGRLVREIRDYLDLFMEYGEARNSVTMIHRIIAKIGFFRIIITTNWDVFMERELDILPIVRDSDLVYWDDNKRQLIKLHGCISQPETMVATEDDYNDFIKNKLDTPISNKIKDLMATKTFLFLGYSLKDESFQLIQEKVLSKMGKFSRNSYAVLREPTNEYIKLWKNKGITIIPSNALAFLRQLHEIFVQKGVYFGDGFLSKLSKLIDKVYATHFSLDQEEAIGFSSAMYQDGLQHSLGNLYHGIMTGKPKSHYEKRLEMFLDRWKEQVKKGNLVEIAYLRGRVEALKWALNPKKELNLYCDTDCEPINQKQFSVLSKSFSDKLV